MTVFDVIVVVGAGVIAGVGVVVVIVETEFGFVLRGDFSSQWRSLQGADFYNGSGLGYWLNTLNDQQIYGIHIAAIPMLIIALLFMHYLLVRILGIAKPYRKDIVVKTVPANHTLLFVRGGSVVVLIMILGFIFPSPYLQPITIKEVATGTPQIMASTLIKEFDNSSGTAGYVDNIAPYTFNARSVYISAPYAQLHATQDSSNLVAAFNKLPDAAQTDQLTAASKFFETWDGASTLPTDNFAISIVGELVNMARAGLYEPSLASANAATMAGNSTTYSLRFLADTGALKDKASSLQLTTDQYGMLHEESGFAPGAWWLAPIGFLNHTILNGDENGDRDAALIFGSAFIILLAFPFIPGLNQIPDKLKVYKLIWHVKQPRKK